jgi:uncharacterized oxidoreductase
MNLQNKTILITGAGSGIGLAIAKALAGNGNKLILTGRNKEKLQAAAASLKDATPVVSDATSEQDIDQLVATVQKDFGSLDILVNNAGLVFGYMLSANANAYAKARAEMETNYLAPIRLTEKFLPLLEKSGQAAIVNISSLQAFLSVPVISTYAASKAALHSYTIGLRLTLQGKSPHIGVFEIMPPFVDTDFSRGVPVAKMSAAAVADDVLRALQTDQYEIHSGIAETMYQQYLASPEAATLVFNGIKK